MLIAGCQRLRRRRLSQHRNPRSQRPNLRSRQTRLRSRRATAARKPRRARRAARCGRCRAAWLPRPRPPPRPRRPAPQRLSRGRAPPLPPRCAILLLATMRSSACTGCSALCKSLTGKMSSPLKDSVDVATKRGRGGQRSAGAPSQTLAAFAYSALSPSERGGHPQLLRVSRRVRCAAR